MLIETGDGAALVVCTTCRAGGDAKGDADGARLLEALQDALVRHPAEGVLALQPMACLFACASACSVYLRAPGKMGYLLGRICATPADATALLDYAAAYLRSADGAVTFADWPEGVKGRFIARLPPQGRIWADP